MRVYQLLWTLMLGALRGRFRDEVFVSVEWRNAERDGGATAPIVHLRWETRADGFCMIEGETAESPYADSVFEANN